MPNNQFPKIEDPRTRAFFERAADHIEQTGNPCEIVIGTPEFDAWVDFFERVVGQIPHVVRLVCIKGEGSITMPTQWPQWFEESPRLTLVPK